MADTTAIDGTNQIQPSTITDVAVSPSAAIQLSKLQTGTYIILASGAVAMIASLNMGSQSIINVLDPVNLQDAATKNWVLAQTAAGKFFVDGTDSTSGYATSKIIALSPVTLNVLNGGSNEQLQVSVPVFVEAGVSGAPGLVPYPGTTVHDPPWSLGDNGQFNPPSTGINGLLASAHF